MANELTITSDFTYVKGLANLGNAFQPGEVSFDVAGVPFVAHEQVIGDSETAIDMGSVTAPGYCWMRNIDDTDWIQILRATGETAFAKLKPGMMALLPLDPAGATALMAIADTGKTPTLLYVILSE